MPRYIYFCENCQLDFTVFHGINDVQVACIKCESDKIKKMLTKPIRLNNNKKQKSTGNLTKKYIEDNREILEALKQETKKNYDGT